MGALHQLENGPPPGLQPQRLAGGQGYFVGNAYGHAWLHDIHLSTPQFAARHLSDSDMDCITAGQAYATSTASAQATGATAFTSVSDLSLVSSGSINGAPVVSYATLQGHALAAQAESTQASAAGQLAIGNGTMAGIEAATTSSAKATGPGARARATRRIDSGARHWAIITTPALTVKLKDLARLPNHT